MACRSCSSSNGQRSVSYGCRKNLQRGYWNGYSAGGYANGNYAYYSRSNANCKADCSSCSNTNCGNNNNGCRPCSNANCGAVCRPCGNTNCGAVCRPYPNANCGTSCNSCSNTSCGNMNCGGTCSSCGCTNCNSCGSNNSNPCRPCSNANCGCICNSCGNNNSCIMPRSTSTSYTGSPVYCGSVEPVYYCTANHLHCGCTNQSCNPSCGNCSCGCANCSCGCTNCSGTNGCGTTCDSCGCSDSCCGGAAIYGYFTQQNCLCLNAGEVIPFDGAAASNGIEKSGGALTVTEGGAYMITLSAMIPANAALTTDLVTLIDDGIAAGGTLIIDKSQTCEPLYLQTQTVVSVAAGSVIRVISSEAINLNGCDRTVSLTIVKVG